MKVAPEAAKIQLHFYCPCRRRSRRYIGPLPSCLLCGAIFALQELQIAIHSAYRNLPARCVEDVRTTFRCIRGLDSMDSTTVELSEQIPEGDELRFDVSRLRVGIPQEYREILLLS